MQEMQKLVAKNEYFGMYEGDTTKQLTNYCRKFGLKDVRVLRVIPHPEFDSDEYNDCYVMYKGKKAIFHGTYSEMVAKIESNKERL